MKPEERLKAAKYWSNQRAGLCLETWKGAVDAFLAGCDAEAKELIEGPDGINSLRHRVKMYLAELERKDAEIIAMQEVVEAARKIQEWAIVEIDRHPLRELQKAIAKLDGIT